MVLMVVALVLAVGGSLAGTDGGSTALAKHKKHKKHKKRKKKPVGGAWDSQVTLSLPTITHFEGVVSSKLDACRNQRLVSVYYTEPRTGQVLPLSVQRTDFEGRYAFDLPKPAYSGVYQAVLIEEQVKAKKAPQICKAAESVTLAVSGNGS
jgi:hypothetical protein